MQVNTNLAMNKLYLQYHHRITSGSINDCFVSHILIFNFSHSTLEDYEQQVKQLQQKLSQNENERKLLRERLNEVELEFQQTIDDRASTIAMYEQQLQSLVQQRSALVNQHQLQSMEK